MSIYFRASFMKETDRLSSLISRTLLVVTRQWVPNCRSGTYVRHATAESCHVWMSTRLNSMTDISAHWFDQVIESDFSLILIS